MNTRDCRSLLVAALALAGALLLPQPAAAQFGDEISNIGIDIKAEAYAYLEKDQAALEIIEDALKVREDDDKFQWLRRKRNEVQIILPRQQAKLRELDSRLNALESALSRRKGDKQFLEDRIRSVRDEEKPGLKRERERIAGRKQQLEEQLAELEERTVSLDVLESRTIAQEQALLDLSDRMFSLTSELNYLEERELEIEDRSGFIDQRVTDLESKLARVNGDIDDLETLIPEMEQNTRSLRDLFALTNQYVKDLDDAIGLLLIPETAQNKFKLTITAAFTGLVLIVILGFFVVSWRDEEVRRSIFSSQSGIQFLTLFSLVIAIILFGILNILEGKELAALLGGLSGYILGRVTGIDRPSGGDGKGQPGAAPPAPTPAPAPAPSPAPAPGAS